MFIFCIYNLYFLYLESNSIEYIFIDEIQNEPNFSICLPFKSIILKEFKDTNDSLKFRFTVNELLFATFLYYFSNDTANQKLIFFESSYLYNYHTCFLFKSKNFNLIFNYVKNLRFKMFMFFDNQQELYFHENVYTHDLEEGFFKLCISHEATINLPPPYETKCKWYTNENLDFKSKEIIRRRSACLLECFKTVSRSLNYFYSTKDNEPLFVCLDEFNFDKSNWSMITKGLNRTEEKKCRDTCNDEDCELRYYSIAKLKSSNNFTIEYKSTIWLAKPLLTRNTFFLEFFGLIALFLNWSFNEIISILIKKMLDRFSLFNCQLAINLNFWIIRLAIMVLSLALLIGFSIFSISTYLDFKYRLMTTISYSTEISPFFTVICVTINNFINTDALDSNEEAKLLDSKSFGELENITNFDKFKKGISKFYIKYASKTKRVKWQLDRSKIWFRNYNSSLFRCFKIDFFIREFRFERLLSLSELHFILKFDWFIVFTLNIKQDFSTFHQPIDPKYTVYRVTIERLSNCSNYNEYSNCDTRSSCIDTCINNGYLEKHRNFSIYSLIDKDTIPLNYSLESIYFEKNKIENEIKEECDSKFPKLDCEQNIYKTLQNPNENYKDRIFRINLYHIRYFFHEKLELSNSTLLLNLITLISIFVGLNFRKFLYLSLNLIKTHFFSSNSQFFWTRSRHRSRFNKNINWSKYFIFFTCLIFFVVHMYLIINEVLNGELAVRVQPLAFRDIRAPNIVICFKIDQNSIDENKELTVEYLDSLTSNLGSEVFENISYFDETFQMHYFNKDNKHLDIVTYWYFLDLKCFEIRFEAINNDKYLFLLDDMMFVRFKFNISVIYNFYRTDLVSFYFTSKKCDTNELNKMEKIELNLSNNVKVKRKTIVEQEIFKFTYLDKYNFFKNLPFSLIYKSVNLNNSNKYIRELKEGYENLNFRTKNLPLSKIANDQLLIEDSLFEQYFRVIKNRSDHSLPKERNFNREFYYNSLRQENTNLDDYDFFLFLNAFISTTDVTNKNNYQKLICVFINSLSLWFNFVILDLYIYLQKLKYPISIIYDILLKLKVKFKPNLD